MIDELERLRAFDASQPPPDEQTRRAARASLNEALLAARDTSAGRVRRWPLAGIVAIGMAVLAAAVVLVPGSASSPPSAVAAVLNRMAAVAAHQPTYVPSRGQYLYVDSRSDYQTTVNGPCMYSALEHRQIWIGADGSGLLRESFGPAVFPSPEARTACLQQGDPGQFHPYRSDSWFAARCFQLGPTNDMAALSTDPVVLLRQMRRIDGGPRTAAEDFVHIGDFLRETDASPALRAALYRAAALIPGVRLLGRVSDHLGRPGLGVAFRRQSELIFDPNTSALMGEQYYAPDGRLAEWAVYLSQRVVGGLPARAPLPLRPPCVNGGGYVHQTPRGSVQTGAPPSP